MQQTLHVIAVNLGGMLSHTTQHDTQTLNATDIACHSREAGAVLSNTTQPSIQTLSTVDITCHSREPLTLLQVCQGQFPKRILLPNTITLGMI